MNTRQSPQETRLPLMRLCVAVLIAVAVAGTVAPVIRDAYARLAASVQFKG